ncbi:MULTISPECIES: hypothetical protein [unclassified Coleofasciculus]|uniref:hypothetical protein n=1 Tax=Cyanophyceae TaxID=3028117 RepID=UPI001688A47F|nr:MULTISPECIES: hypothetical protein [unclassified Coleofasciculus]MBD1838417.1 hypothetical protein [Coleofasciculus sp. FACHB-501]MBD1901016.1 hypothetical protein [Coleofasciculus sp. FACHB-125]
MDFLNLFYCERIKLGSGCDFPIITDVLRGVQCDRVFSVSEEISPIQRQAKPLLSSNAAALSTFAFTNLIPAKE